MECQTRALGYYTGFSFDRLSRGVDTDIAKFLAMTRVDPASVDWSTVKRLNGLTVVRGQTYSPALFPIRHDRFCAHCLLDDEESRKGPRGARGFIRMSWLPRFVCTCEIHGISLATASLPRSQSIIGDFYHRMRSTGLDLHAAARNAEMSQPGHLQTYFLMRFRGQGGNGTWMDDLPLQSVCHLSELIGLVERHGPSGVLLAELSELERKERGTFGYSVLVRGKEEFRAKIGHVAHQFYEQRKQSGATSLFGALATNMMCYSDLPGYQALLDIMQDVAIRRLPIGPGDNFFGPVRERKLHSVWTARKEYKIGRHAMITHLVKAGLIPADSDLNFQNRIVFPAGSLTDAMKDSACTVSFAKALVQLGTKAHTLKSLIGEGILTYKELPSITGKTTFGFLKQSEIDGLLGRLRSFEAKDAIWREAATPLGLMRHNAGIAIQMLLHGDLKQAIWLYPERGLDGLHFHRREWINAKARAITPKMNHRQVMGFLSVDRETVHQLVSAQYLPSKAVAPGLSKGLYSRERVEQFASEFASVAKLSTITRSNTATVVKWITDNQIKPAISLRTDFYRISNVKLNQHKVRA